MVNDSKITLSIILLLIILAVGWTIWKKPYAGNMNGSGKDSGTTMGDNGTGTGNKNGTGSSISDTSDTGISADLGNIDSELGGLDNDYAKSAPGSDDQ